ncbi:hypothetical protein GOP47_0026457 [Adiantum capillus-veneris]|nr:hypothetical protein GOP47_0026457 [Adiantum capillus-veneris]
MDMERSPPPLAKRLKPGSSGSSSSCALRFSLSPQSIDAKDAIALKEKDPNLSLRLTSTEEFSPKKALRENIRPGFAFSVWPSQTGQTNKVFKELMSFRDDYLLYFHLLQTSFVQCLGDSIGFVLAILDHCLRRLASTDKSFEVIFIGLYAKKPFQSDKAEHITYLILLKFIGYLQKQVDADKQKGDEQTEASALLARCFSLLEATEFSLISLMENLGAQVEDRRAFAEFLRNDLLVYRDLPKLFAESTPPQEEAKDKDDRNFGSHPFTTMLWTQFKTPLAQLAGMKEKFPQVHGKIFKEDVLGKLALLLADLESKFNNGATGDNYKTVLPAAFFLIKEFMKRNNEHERVVKCIKEKSCGLSLMLNMSHCHNVERPITPSRQILVHKDKLCTAYKSYTGSKFRHLISTVASRMGTVVLGSLVTGVGTPRIQVWAPAATVFLDVVELLWRESSFRQRVSVLGCPDQCLRCQSFGHHVRDCPRPARHPRPQGQAQHQGRPQHSSSCTGHHSRELRGNGALLTVGIVSVVRTSRTPCLLEFQDSRSFHVLLFPQYWRGRALRRICLSLVPASPPEGHGSAPRLGPPLPLPFAGFGAMDTVSRAPLLVFQGTGLSIATRAGFPSGSTSLSYSWIVLH